MEGQGGWLMVPLTNHLHYQDISGKSSLIQSLLQMLELTSGAINIDSIDLSTIPKEAVRSRISTVPQEAVFIEGTLRLNIDPQGAKEAWILGLAMYICRMDCSSCSVLPEQCLKVVGFCFLTKLQAGSSTTYVWF